MVVEPPSSSVVPVLVSTFGGASTSTVRSKAALAWVALSPLSSVATIETTRSPPGMEAVAPV